MKTNLKTILGLSLTLIILAGAGCAQNTQNQAAVSAPQPQKEAAPQITPPPNHPNLTAPAKTYLTNLEPATFDKDGNVLEHTTDFIIGDAAGLDGQARELPLGATVTLSLLDPNGLLITHLDVTVDKDFTPGPIALRFPFNYTAKELKNGDYQFVIKITAADKTTLMPETKFPITISAD